MSQFDPSLFLTATTTEANTKRPPLPSGADFQATIGELIPRQWTGKADPTKGGVVIDVPLTIDLDAYPDTKAALGGVSRISLKDGIMLDLNEAGSIDFGPGKNGKLRRYRDSLGMNIPGEPFSIQNMQGRMVKIKIKHRSFEGDVFDEVDSVSKI